MQTAEKLLLCARAAMDMARTMPTRPTHIVICAAATVKCGKKMDITAGNTNAKIRRFCGSINALCSPVTAGLHKPLNIHRRVII